MAPYHLLTAHNIASMYVSVYKTLMICFSRNIAFTKTSLRLRVAITLLCEDIDIEKFGATMPMNMMYANNGSLMNIFLEVR